MKKLTHYIKFIVAPVTLLLAKIACAQESSLGQTAGHITYMMDLLNRFLTAGSYTLGFGFCVGSLVKYKDYRHDPRQNNISSVFILALIGTVFLLLPLVSSIASGKIFTGNMQ